MPVSTVVAAEKKRAYHHLYETLLERQRARFIAIAARSVGYDDAEDVAQTALLKAYQGLPSYQGEWQSHALNRWMRTILEHVIIDHQRVLAARNETALLDSHEFLTAADMSDAWQAAREAILSLIPEIGLTHAQEICMRRRLDGHTQTAIAAEMGVSQPAVSQHTKAALVKLQAGAPETFMWLVINSSQFRALCKATVYHKPQTTGAGLAREKQKRLR